MTHMYTTIATLINHAGEARSLEVSHDSAVYPFYLLRDGRLFVLAEIKDKRDPFVVMYRECPNRTVDVSRLPWLSNPLSSGEGAQGAGEVPSEAAA